MTQAEFFSLLYYLSAFGLASRLATACKRRKMGIWIVMLFPVILAMFRYNVGYDYGSYITGYQVFSNLSYQEIISSYRLGDPIAFYLITKLSSAFRSDRIYLMIMALLGLMPGLGYILSEWQDSECLGLIVFRFLFGPFIFGFSACKQGIALGFLMASLSYVYRRKPIGFLICVAVASLFHSTALVFIPVYFFTNKRNEVQGWKKALIITGCILAILNLRFILERFLEGRFEGYATEIVEGRNRTFWLYSLLALLFVVYRKQLIAIDNRNELLIILIVIGAILQYLGFFNAFTKRIGEYFTMAQVFLIPQTVQLFTKNSRKIAEVLIVIFTILLFVIGHQTAASGMGFLPYYFKFF